MAESCESMPTAATATAASAVFSPTDGCNLPVAANCLLLEAAVKAGVGSTSSILPTAPAKITRAKTSSAGRGGWACCWLRAPHLHRVLISLPDGLSRSCLTLVSSPPCVTAVISTRGAEAEQAWRADMKARLIFRPRNGVRGTISEKKTKRECVQVRWGERGRERERPGTGAPHARRRN